jgi:hypothetical protein
MTHTRKLRRNKPRRMSNKRGSGLFPKGYNPIKGIRNTMTARPPASQNQMNTMTATPPASQNTMNSMLSQNSELRKHKACLQKIEDAIAQTTCLQKIEQNMDSIAETINELFETSIWECLDVCDTNNPLDSKKCYELRQSISNSDGPYAWAQACSLYFPGPKSKEFYQKLAYADNILGGLISLSRKVNDYEKMVKDISSLSRKVNEYEKMVKDIKMKTVI